MTDASHCSRQHPHGYEEANEAMYALIERSSLGTPEAKALRESVSPDQAERIVEASYLMDNTAGIWQEVAYERGRAHLKHGPTSMESLDPFDLVRLTVLLEEVGEVARWFNEWRHASRSPKPAPLVEDLRDELVQVAAMAAAWADALTKKQDQSASSVAAGATPDA